MSFNFSTPTRYQPGGANTFAPSTPAPTAAQAQPNVQNVIKGSTPFSQLDPVLRQRIEFLQKYMHEEKVVSEELAQHSTAQLNGVSDEADDISEKLQSLLGTLESDRQTALALKKEVVKELKNVEIAARTIERFNTPMATYNQNNQLPSKYFWDLLDSFNQRMVEYNQTIRMIEKYVAGAAERRVYTPQMLGEVLRNHVNAFLELSAEVAAVHESVNELRQIWTQRKRAMGIVSEETESTTKKRDLGAAQLLAAWTALQAQNKPATGTATGSSMNLTMTPTSSTSQPSSGLSFAFGASQPSTGTSTFAFGTPTATTGTTTTGTTTTPGFGTTPAAGATSGTSFSFGSSSTTSSFSFGAPSTTTGATTAAPSTTSFSFGTPSTSTGAFTFGTAKK